jgi:hypothetical protein
MGALGKIILLGLATVDEALELQQGVDVGTDANGDAAVVVPDVCWGGGGELDTLPAWGAGDARRFVASGQEEGREVEITGGDHGHLGARARAITQATSYWYSI